MRARFNQPPRGSNQDDRNLIVGGLGTQKWPVTPVMGSLLGKHRFQCIRSILRALAGVQMNYSVANKLAARWILEGGVKLEPMGRDEEILVRYQIDMRLEGRLVNKTISVYWYGAHHFLQWLDRSNIPLEDCRKRHLELYRYYLTAEPAHHKNGSPRDPSTVYRVLVSVKYFSRWALSRGHIKRDPWKDFHIRRPKDRPMMPLSMEEVATLLRGSLAYCAHPWEIARMHALIVLVADLGLRISTEALALDRVDVESSQGMRDRFTVGAKGLYREVPLNPVPAAAIRRYLDLRTDSHPALFVTSPYRGTGRIRRFPYTHSHSALKYIAVRCGLEKEKVTWHMLRRTAATQSLLSGVDMFSVMELYGWRRVATVQRYVGAGARREALATHRAHSLAGRILGDLEIESPDSGQQDRSIGGSDATAHLRYARVAHDPWNSIIQE